MAVAGAKVALCELERGTIASDERGGTGGTCVLRGCVPKKLMAYAGRFTEDFINAKGFGYVDPQLVSPMTRQNTAHLYHPC